MLPLYPMDLKKDTTMLEGIFAVVQTPTPNRIIQKAAMGRTGSNGKACTGEIRRIPQYRSTGSVRPTRYKDA